MAMRILPIIRPKRMLWRIITHVAIKIFQKKLDTESYHANMSVSPETNLGVRKMSPTRKAQTEILLNMLDEYGSVNTLEFFATALRQKAEKSYHKGMAKILNNTANKVEDAAVKTQAVTFAIIEDMKKTY
jgi:hypothetical protein